MKQMAAHEGKSVAELVRISLDAMLRCGKIRDHDEARRRARAAAGCLHGPSNLAADHDEFLADAQNFGEIP
ncbi:MAG: hypothetical protein L0Z70_01080 [Chloroflexi bacterium]|nr:hypothetical protein [Chloroflexota bacterium]